MKIRIPLLISIIISLSCKQYVKKNESLQPIKYDGKKLFLSSCSPCHSIDSKKFGPALMNYSKNLNSYFNRSQQYHKAIKLDSLEIKSVELYIDSNRIYVDP